MNSLELPLRNPCPPGACVCERERLQQPGADARVLRLTREEEKRLIARLEGLQSLEDLQRMQQKLQEQLGVRLVVEPGPAEVRSALGVRIELQPQPGLCRKTCKAVPAAVRRAMVQQPPILWALLDSRDLLG